MVEALIGLTVLLLLLVETRLDDTEARVEAAGVVDIWLVVETELLETGPTELDMVCDDVGEDVVTVVDKGSTKAVLLEATVVVFDTAATVEEAEVVVAA